LERYKLGLGERFGRGLVTGIERPTWEVDGWKFVDFGTINDRIENVARESKQLDAFSKELTLRYCRTVRALIKVLNEFVNNNEDHLVPTEGRSYLEPIRLEDLAGKLLGERFVEYLQRDKDLCLIKAQVEKMGLQFLVRPDFFKKHVVIDVRIVADERSAEDVAKDHGAAAQWLIGVQIEDCSYARCAQVGAGIRLNGQRPNRENVFGSFNQKGWLPKKTELPGEPLKRRLAYGTYQKQGVYCFVYQPYRLEDLAFSAIKDRIVADMKSAVGIAAEIKKELNH